ncbi:hypothetical protein JTE90_015585 [Oedothorax gibbosus]|uniref:Uncharacterized protein n=1 Tax=Oedothorax gibbosus TaxID=931172 RepID=A0AAV6TJ95_9ARAC|nr:hypothetical protein JTE90_015585 [Oedothorax gibbosus]
MRLNSMSASYPEGNFGGNQLLDGSISLTPLDPDLTIVCTSEPLRTLHQSLPLASSCPGIVHHLSVPTCALKLRHFHKWKRGGSPVRPAREERGSRMRPTSAGLYFHFAAGLIQDPLTRAHVRLLGPCFRRVRFVLRRSKNFTSSVAITNAPVCSSYHYLVFRNQQNRTEVLFHYSMHHCSGVTPALSTLILFKVKLCAVNRDNPVRSSRETGWLVLERAVTAVRRTARLELRSNYELLTATTLIYAIGASVTAAAGTWLALQLIIAKGFRVYSFHYGVSKESRIVIFRHYLPVPGSG